VSESGEWTATGPSSILVTKESATFAVPTEATHDQISINTNHSRMIQFDSMADQAYMNIVTKLAKCMENGPNIPTQEIALSSNTISM
jgi:hypothetical protein